MPLRLAKVGIQIRLFFYSLLLILMALVSGGLILEEWLRKWRVDDIERDMVVLSRSIVVYMEESSHSLDDSFMDRMADRVGNEAGVRITFINQQGHVIGDSSVELSHLSQVDNHFHRPEVIQALQIGMGSAMRHSSTVDKDMLYVSTLLKKRGHKIVVRVARSLDEVQDDIVRLRYMVLIATLPALLLAILMSSIMSRYATRSLRNLIRTAKGMVGETSSHQQIGLPTTHDDIDHLAISFTYMAEEVKRLMDGLSSERDRLRTILEGMSEAVIAVDRAGVVTLVNPAARLMLQCSTELTGHNLDEVLPGECCACIKSGAPRRETWYSEFDLSVTQATPPRRVQVYAACIPADGSCVMVLRDVTDQRRLELMRRDLIASASHELRTPVSVIRLNAETLLDGAIEELDHAVPLVEAIERQALRLTHLISDMLDISLLESGRYHIVPVQISPHVVVERVVEALTPLAEGKKTTLVNAVDPRLGAMADGRALEQILINLLNNAIKYTPGGGRVVVRSSTLSPTHHQLEVVDNGPGIDPQHHSRIFERFYRVDPGRSREVGGTGLGLSIVKHLVETMGCKVGVRQVEPHGCCFWFTLPVAML